VRAGREQGGGRTGAPRENPPSTGPGPRHRIAAACNSRIGPSADSHIPAAALWSLEQDGGGPRLGGQEICCLPRRHRSWNLLVAVQTALDRPPSSTPAASRRAARPPAPRITEGLQTAALHGLAPRCFDGNGPGLKSLELMTKGRLAPPRHRQLSNRHVIGLRSEKADQARAPLRPESGHRHHRALPFMASRGACGRPPGSPGPRKNQLATRPMRPGPDRCRTATRGDLHISCRQPPCSSLPPKGIGAPARRW